MANFISSSFLEGVAAGIVATAIVAGVLAIPRSIVFVRESYRRSKACVIRIQRQLSSTYADERADGHSAVFTRAFVCSVGGVILWLVGDVSPSLVAFVLRALGLTMLVVALLWLQLPLRAESNARQ